MRQARTPGGGGVERKHVFTYGSLMFAPVWQRVVRGRYRRAAAGLAGYERHRVRDESYPALLAATSAAEPVSGVVYLDVSRDDLAALDRFEGDDYQRITVLVTLAAGDRAAGLPATLPAEAYLFLPHDRVDRGAWDPVGFEQARLAAFLARHGPPD